MRRTENAPQASEARRDPRSPARRADTSRVELSYGQIGHPRSGVSAGWRLDRDGVVRIQPDIDRGDAFERDAIARECLAFGRFESHRPLGSVIARDENALRGALEGLADLLPTHRWHQFSGLAA